MLEPASLAGLPALRELRLAECGLRSLAGLAAAPRLQCADLSGNRVADVAEFDRLGDMVTLWELTLANNPVARKQASARARVGPPSDPHPLSPTALPAPMHVSVPLAPIRFCAVDVLPS